MATSFGQELLRLIIGSSGEGLRDRRLDSRRFDGGVSSLQEGVDGGTLAEMEERQAGLADPDFILPSKSAEYLRAAPADGADRRADGAERGEPTQ